MNRRTALVLGGTGTVGRAVVELLSQRDVAVSFTYHMQQGRAGELAERTRSHAYELDLAHRGALQALFARLESDDRLPTVLVHAAAINPPAPFLEIDEPMWERLVAINATSALIACQEMGRRTPPGTDSHVVLVGALDRTQSLPIPAPFAATQGMLGTLAMAAAKELGPLGVRVNLVALGPLDGGLSTTLPPQVLDDFVTFSALRRRGTAAEAAEAIAWLALENTYMNGKILPVNGGI